MIAKEAILKSLEDLGGLSNSQMVYEHTIKNNYCDWTNAKTPLNTISARLGAFIRDGDTRVKRIKKDRVYFYYLSKLESEITFDDEGEMDVVKGKKEAPAKQNKTYYERDLHKLLSTYLNSQDVYSKTIFHEKSKAHDANQKWIHPDMVGVKFLNFKTKETQAFLRTVNKSDALKITSYEIKKEINTDSDLKKYYFQAFSNSNWANYGYLVAFEINDSLAEEMERLNQSFGIGVILLKSNPFESKILYSSKYKELDFKTIDKISNVNSDFKEFINKTHRVLLATDEEGVKERTVSLRSFCDKYFEHEADIEKYCKQKNIPMEIFSEE
jgi:hypothetical protein